VLRQCQTVILTSVVVLPQQVTLQPSTEPQIAADAAITATTAMNAFIVPIYTHCICRPLYLLMLIMYTKLTNYRHNLTKCFGTQTKKSVLQTYSVAYSTKLSQLV